MDIVMISTGERAKLIEQTLTSLTENAVNPDDHSLTVVLDCPDEWTTQATDTIDTKFIVNYRRKGASRSRNIGASSIPKYLRKKHVMFIDDDIYLCPEWDRVLATTAACLERTGRSIISEYAHPFNHTVLNNGFIEPGLSFNVTNVISSAQMFMPWELWDDVGYFTEPGGPGGSEDVDYCKRASDKGYSLVVTNPHHAIHCGISRIVGREQLAIQNMRLMALYDINGKVAFA